MRAWDELDVAEIAVILEISAANVSSRLYKARRRLTDEIVRRDPEWSGHVQGESSWRKEKRS
jgi:DNA-directed RNA polymerase specialized sigma24 family protein